MSAEPCPFGFAADGGTIAAGDGPELLVWKFDGIPAWKQFLEGILVAVAVGAEQVLALDADSRLSRFRRTTGELLDCVELGGRPLDAKLAATGTIGVLTASGVLLIDATGRRQEIRAPGATAFAFGPGGASVGIGTADGTFTAVEIASGAAWGAVPLPSPVVAVDWSALGTWVVGAGVLLHRVSGDGKTLVATIPGADFPIERVACSADGLVCAAHAGEHVELYELLTNRPLGEFVLRRRVGGIAFGGAHLLGIGLDDGDANVVDVATMESFRTEPHPGRGRTTWRLENKVDLMAVRGAIAAHKAGGQPIARYVPPPRQDEASSGLGCLGGCAGVVGVLLVLTLFCAGVGLAVYVLKSYGIWVPTR